jgi:dipeptidyl-peptidase-4
LTQLDGQNDVSMSPAKRTFTVVNSTPERPFRTDFHLCSGKHLAAVQKADERVLESLEHVRSEQFTVTAADDETVLWGVMHKPVDFDPKKRYPIIDHLYAGPQVSMVCHGFGFGAAKDSRIDYGGLDRALTQLGYIVISVDARGTPERSKAFQDVVYGNWGRHEIADHAATIRQLGHRHSFVDVGRVGVWGHSWGGYFAIRALMQAPDTFHVGVAVSPNTDAFDLFIYEPYLDLPSRAKAAYHYASNYRWADRVVGDLMLVTGACDPTPYSNSLKMSHYLIQAGVDYELVVLPDAGHYFQGRNLSYFISKLVRHFETHLKSRVAACSESVPG